MQITKDTLIEDLVEDVPGAVRYLMNEGIRCIVCGEPVWGTLEEAAEEKGFKADTIERFVKDLNELYEKGEDESDKYNGPKIDVDNLNT